MRSLTVFHDPNCGLCRSFRIWLEAQPLWVAVRFIGFDTPEAELLFPEIGSMGADQDCVVLADDGRWWQGPEAWLVCLWATKTHRVVSHRLASPMFRPWLRKLVHGISSRRVGISGLLGLRSERDLEDRLREVECDGGSCRIPGLQQAKMKGAQ